MWLDDFVPSEWMDSWPKSAEVSEKFKESVKKASAWIKRVQKDEKKARKYDNLLAWFLIEIIKNDEFDFLHEEIFNLINLWFWSNFVLWMISLIYQPISLKIREISSKEIINFDYNIWFEISDFNDDLLDNEIKNRINYWIEDIFDVISIDFSSLQIKNMLKLFELNEYNDIEKFWILIFCFFFKKLNIKISKNQSKPYINFILNELVKKINTIKLEKI